VWFVFDTYRRLISFQIRAQPQYRVAFLAEIVATAIIMSTFFLSLIFVFQRFGHMGGWTLGEVAFLWGMIELAFGVMDMIFSGFDPANFGQRVRQGSFDQLLLRPLSLTLQVLGSEFVIRRLGRVLQGAVIFGLALALVDIQWTPAKLLYLPLVVLSLVCFFGGLFIIGATITFWTVESIEVINIFTYGGSELMSYPMHIYRIGCAVFLLLSSRPACSTTTRPSFFWTKPIHLTYLPSPLSWPP
jgi:ABC-2 type transport system permease protein